jgi:hypothetical protein
VPTPLPANAGRADASRSTFRLPPHLEGVTPAELPPWDVRPAWAPEWVPTWAVTLRPALQLVVMLGLYVLHMLVLSQLAVPFPVQLLPNRHGLFQSISLDSVAGEGRL